MTPACYSPSVPLAPTCSDKLPTSRFVMCCAVVCIQAPEVHSKLPYNEKVDQFSLGVLIYEVLLGVGCSMGCDSMGWGVLLSRQHALASSAHAVSVFVLCLSNCLSLSRLVELRNFPSATHPECLCA